MHAVSFAGGKGDKRLLKESEARLYVSMGQTAFREWAKEIGARRTFGRAVMYDKATIDRTLDLMSAESEKGAGNT